MTNTPHTRSSKWLVGVIVIVVGLASIAIVMSFNPATDNPSSTSAIESDTAHVMTLAQVEGGDTLINDAYECYVCHVSGNSQIAPAFEQLIVHANTNPRGLSPAAYLYESIVFPSAYIVEGYNNSMPNNYGDRLSEQELGTMIVYLLETYVTP